MKHKVILVLLDGLNYEVARHALGHLQAYCAAGRAALYKLECELPALSRPLYECIMTGVAPIDSGVVHNDVVRLSKERSIFHYARDAGLTTAAAAYHWMSELYNRAPFVAARDRHTSDAALPIQHGHFYYADHYPDSHLFADAESLRLKYAPDFLLVHPMNIDDAGHGYGLDSPQYRYQVLVTADHGMNNDRSHNGLLAEEREVPLLVLGDAFSLDASARPRQTELCGTVCTLLGATHDKPLCKDLLK
jgi:predicted AlkP superfamily pyrophosphatase or phosphodiesterase